LSRSGTERTRAQTRPRVTISDVAEALGLAKGTVSRALNGYPDIADLTRIRVRKTAERMGYRPLSHAQAIRTGRVRSIGLVLQIDEHDAHGPFLTDFLAGATQAAGAEGWTLSVATAYSDADMRAVLDRLITERKADGFILQRSRRRDPRVAVLRAAGVPFVLYGRTGYGLGQSDAGLSWYDIAGETAMARAVHLLVDLGHRRIGFAGGGEEYNFSHLRRAGFETAMVARGLPCDPALTVFGGRQAEDGARIVARFMALDRPPTAIVFAVDQAALGAWDVVPKLGLEIGRDVSVVGYDNIPEGRFIQPPLSTFRVDSRAAGARVAQLLIRQCRGEPPETLRELTEAAWQPRGSHGVPAAAPAGLAAKIRAAKTRVDRPAARPAPRTTTQTTGHI